MLRLIGLVVAIGLADSLNPSTIAPALYLASGERARKRVFEFTLGVFVASLAGGMLIALGPGELLRSVLPHPRRTTRSVIEIIAGVAMLVAAMMLWRHRHRLREREPPMPSAEGKSSALLGATITAVELPTALPYFAAIAAIVGSGVGPVRQMTLLLLFNLCFVAPLIAIFVVLEVTGDRAEAVLRSARMRLQAHWPALLATLALIAGTFVIWLGATGLAGRCGVRAKRCHPHRRATRVVGAPRPSVDLGATSPQKIAFHP